MDIIHLIQSALLGSVQGLTEFLPVSSSGHLKLFPWLFGWETHGLVFDTSLHLGTALALLIFFYKDYFEIAKCTCLPRFAHDKAHVQKNRKLALFILIGMLPAGLVGLFFDDFIEGIFPSGITNEGMLVVAAAFIFFGVLLWVSDKHGRKKTTIDTLTIRDALTVGFLQILAFIPGASRSGVTMTAGMASGLTRDAAARFSFLIGTPLILAAGIFKLKDLAELNLTTELLSYFGVGILSSLIVGYFCIKFFLAYLKTHSVKVFTAYRILLGLAVIGIASYRIFL